MSDVLEPQALRARPEQFFVSLGGDPGGGNGFFLAAWGKGRHRAPLLTRAWVTNMDGAVELLDWVLREYGTLIGAAGLEQFDNRARSRRMRGFSATLVHTRTARLVTQLNGAGIPVTVRPPALVKPWATDRRLEAAGLMTATAGMPGHARDAARHCLYCACHDLGMRDPMSRSRTEDDHAQVPGSG